MSRSIKRPVVEKKRNKNQQINQKIQKRNIKRLNADGIIKKIKENDCFAGIVEDKKLQYMNILKSPITIVILIVDHWIAVHISNKHLIVFDSLCRLFEENYMNIRRFIKKHMINRQLIITPVLQNATDNSCGYFVTYFVKEVCYKPFTDLMKPFTADSNHNVDYVLDYYSEI